MITPESEEDDESTSETDSGDSDSSEDSDSTASSRESSNLPMEGDAGDSDTGTSRLRSQHKKNKARLKKMVQDDAGSEDDLDLPSGTQPLAMFATVHEIIAPQVTMPSITEVPEDEPIVLIGEVMSIVDSVVVVKSMSTGTQRVLDTDSLLVLENRKVLGLVSAILLVEDRF
jgi:H/ACA ribonucleoprotein complex non-core subunit NAF1